MVELTKNELSILVEEATGKGIKKILGEFNVDRETHWDHHKWLSDFFKTTSRAKKIAWGVFITAISVGSLGLFYKFIIFVIKTEGGI